MTPQMTPADRKELQAADADLQRAMTQARDDYVARIEELRKTYSLEVLAGELGISRQALWERLNPRQR